MSAELQLSGEPARHKRPRPVGLKQQMIVDYLKHTPTIDRPAAVALVGFNIYANAEHHVGAILSRMVRSGLLVRKGRGVYALAEGVA